MHILFLSDNFPPEVNAPASRTFEHAREWVKAGHQVTIITCAPNFPAGKVMDGYRNSIWQEESMEGIRVIRVWSFISANEGFFLRSLDYISFMFSSILAALFIRKVDVIVGTSPQFFTACAAAITSFFKRKPWIFELRDIWPESIKAVGVMGDSMLITMLEKIEIFLYRNCTKVISVTNGFKKSLIARGIDANKIEVVTNGVDMSRFRSMDKDTDVVRELALENCFVAGYVGTLGMAHALETILKAAGKLDKTVEGAGIKFILMGNGARKKSLQMQAQEMQLENLIFVDSVGKEEVSRYLSVLDVSIIHLKSTELFKSVIPSKLFECMAMGIPVIHGVRGESAAIVADNNIGVPMEPENSEQLAKLVIDLRDQPDKLQDFRSNCLVAAQKYNRKNLALNMLQIFETARKTP